MKKELKTLMEWNAIIGDLLENYDGFVSVYDKIFTEHNMPIENDAISRYNSGEMLCTREAFMSGIDGCTITRSSKPADMERIIPEYREKRILYLLNIAFTQITEDFLYGECEFQQSKIDQMKSMIENIKRYRNISRTTYCLEDNVNVQECINKIVDIESDEYVQFWIKGQDPQSVILTNLFNKGTITTVEEFEENLMDKILDGLSKVDSNNYKENFKFIMPELYILCKAVIPCSERQRRIFKNEDSYKKCVNEHYNDFYLPSLLGKYDAQFAESEQTYKKI